MTRKITIEEIANSVGYSKFYFSRIFKAEMNISVMEYVKERKMIRASELILKGEKILDVAIEYGWESHGGFIKAFDYMQIKQGIQGMNTLHIYSMWLYYWYKWEQKKM